MANKVFLTGNITRDPELRFSPGTGTAVTTITLAVNDGYGEKKKTYFPKIVIFGKVAENVANTQVKGNKLGIIGKLVTGSYDNKDGVKVYTTEVIAEEVEYLTPKRNTPGGAPTAAENEGGYNWDEAASEDDQEIPF